MDLIAYGEQLHRNGRLESFVLTEELTGYTPLDHLLPKRFPTISHRRGKRDRHLQALIAHVASIARRFHQAGYNHRDFYCGHFFIKEELPGRFDIKLIDLQRVQHRRHFRRRWIIKDLAQLAWSASRDHISCTDRMAFMRHYLGVPRLRPCDKRLIRAVLARQVRMERKLGFGP
jgi:heptose I phosphotransferase